MVSGHFCSWILLKRLVQHVQMLTLMSVSSCLTWNERKLGKGYFYFATGGFLNNLTHLLVRDQVYFRTDEVGHICD